MARTCGNRIEYDRMSEFFCGCCRAQHGFLRAHRAHVENERGGVRRDLLDLALILCHDSRSAGREDDIRAVINCHRIGDTMGHRTARDRSLNHFFQFFDQRRAPSRLLNTCVRLSADSTRTEIAAPTAVEIRKLGTKVNSAALVLPMRTAAIG